MTANKVPRYLLFVLLLGTAMAIIMLSMFYAQYRWLANEISGISVTEHGELLEASFERRARAQAHDVADLIANSADPNDAVAVLGTMNRALADNSVLTGLRFISAGADVRQAGSMPVVDMETPVTWLPDRLVMTYPVERDGERLGMLAAAFQLEQLRAESEIFAGQLAAKEYETRLSVELRHYRDRHDADTAARRRHRLADRAWPDGAHSGLEGPGRETPRRRFRRTPVPGARRRTRRTRCRIQRHARPVAHDDDFSRLPRQHPVRDERGHHRYDGRRHDREDQQGDDHSPRLRGGRTRRYVGRLHRQQGQDCDVAG